MNVELADVLTTLSKANLDNDRLFPGDSPDRQPVHTVYGGAHRFKAGTAATFAAQAFRTLDTYAPDPASLGVTDVVYQRVVDKLRREPVEDLRIDFEDGYGNRSDAEEDGHAVQAAQEVARGLNTPLFPPFIGLRIKPFTEAARERSMRTLDLFLTTLIRENGDQLPEGFVVTLPKVTIPEQVWALVEVLKNFEQKHRLFPGSMKMELMIETTQSIVNDDGQIAIPALIRAAAGRCRGLHFGAYDYTAACGVTAEYQGITHPVCDFARHVMQVCAAGRGITISDSATNIMPIGPHRGQDLTSEQKQENLTVVRRAMKLHFDDVQRSLQHGIYQGWDLHPAQLPTRYAAVFAFFLQSLGAASTRLNNFVEKAAQATLVGDVFDDAATGQGLLNFFLRGYNCGALTEEQALSAGLTMEELRGKSFLKILNNRRAASAQS
jgi:citrate lyase beta subunit